MKGSGRPAPGWAGAAEVPRSLQSTAGSARVQEEIQVSVVPIWFIHLQPRYSFRIPSNIPRLSWELREQGAGQGQGGSPHPSPGPSSVPRSSSASRITTSVKNLKTSSSSQLGVAAPEAGAAVPRGMAAGGSEKRELEGLDAQSRASSFPWLRAHEFIPCCAPRLCPAVGAAVPWPWDAGLVFPGAPSPLRGPGSGWDPPCSRREW